LGPDAITELLEDGEQTFVAPHTLDAKNPLYRERPHLATYIAAMAALVRYHESKRELLAAMQYRMQAGRLKRLLPENYLKGALYKEKTR
jgi:hypothetical protein